LADRLRPRCGDNFVAPLGEIGLVTRALDAPVPLCGDGLVALLKARQRLECALDRHGRDRMKQSL
jgi:hypothetical protein